MYCSNCGKEVKEGSKFCDECGNRIDLSVDKIDLVNTGKSNLILSNKIYYLINNFLRVAIMILCGLQIIAPFLRSVKDDEDFVNFFGMMLYTDEQVEIGIWLTLIIIVSTAILVTARYDSYIWITLVLAIVSAVLVSSVLARAQEICSIALVGKYEFDAINMSWKTARGAGYIILSVSRVLLIIFSTAYVGFNYVLMYLKSEKM